MFCSASHGFNKPMLGCTHTLRYTGYNITYVQFVLYNYFTAALFFYVVSVSVQMTVCQLASAFAQTQDWYVGCSKYRKVMFIYSE